VGLNFMGLGFNFGAKDSGLENALGQINAGFTGIDTTLQSLQTTALGATGPVEELAAGLADQLSGLQKDVEGGVDLGAAVDTEAADDAAGSLGGLGDAIGGMTAEAEVGKTGFGRMANSVLGGAGKITSAMGWVGMAVGPVISGFGAAAERAGDMVDAVTGIPARIGNQIHTIANQGVNLTNSLEGEAVGLATTARSVGVNMGYLGQDLNRFIGQATGMAMGLNIGADEAARAIRAWDESAETLGATGLSSAQDVARLTAALGVNADVLRNSTLEMQNLGASEDEIHRITSAVALMGRETGDLSGALNELPQILQMLERRRALGDSPEQMAAFAADTAAAARGLFEFTQDSERARSMASELAGTVTESREAFQNMFAGAEAELPQIVTELAIVSGDVNDAFDVMAQGPGGLIEGMGQLVQSTRTQGGDVDRVLEFMRGRLQQVFGAEMTGTLVNFWRTMDSNTIQAMGSVRNATVDLGELGRQAHSTGRTMDEVFERMRGSFQVAMRRISRQDSRDFLRRTRQSLRDLRVAANEAAQSEGPLSDVMGLLSRSQQLGALALLPEELRGSAVAADELRGQIMPLIQAFSSWGGILDTVLGYVGIFATDVISEWGRITRRAKRAGEDLDPMAALGQAIDRQADRYAGILENWIDGTEDFVVRAAEAFGDLNFDALFETTAEGEEEGGVMGAIRRVMNRLAEVDWGRIWKGIERGLDSLFIQLQPWLEEKVAQMREIIFDRIRDWWGQIDWRSAFGEGNEIAAGLWVAFRPALVALGELIGEWFEDNWAEILTWVVIGLAAAIGLLALGLSLALLGLVVGVIALIAAPFVALFDWLYDESPAIIQWFEGLGDDIIEFFEGLGESIGETFDEAVDDWISVFDAVADFFEDLGDDIVGWIRRAMTRAGNVFDQAVEDWGAVFDSIIEFFGTIGDTIRDTIGDAIDWVGEQWDSFVEGLSGVWEGLSEGWDAFIAGAEAVWENLMGVPDRLREGWSGIVQFFQQIFESITETVGEDLQAAGQFFETLADVGTRALNTILGTAEENHENSIHTLIEEDLAQAEAFMTETAQNISTMLTRILHDATVEAIVTGFAMGFATVVEDMDEFSEDMVGAFTHMAEGISGVITDLFTSVVGQSEIAMLATETAVEGIIGRLRTITEAQARLAAARGEAVSTLARPADEDAIRRRMEQLASSPVLQAIHHPDWYGGAEGRGGYQRLFVTHMVALREAIEALSVAPGAGNLEERRRLIREAVPLLEGGRVGGHQRLPQRGR
jgi:phage-related protein